MACRALGFGEGVLLGATPASGICLAAAVLLRGPGALAAGIGFAAGELTLGLDPGSAVLVALGHGFGAHLAGLLMRRIARRRKARSRTSDWMIFLAGVVVFTAVVGVAVFAGLRLGIAASTLSAQHAAALAAVFQPLGLLTFCAAALNLREIAAVWSHPGPAAGIAALAAVLLVILWYVVARLDPELHPSGLTVVLALPLCLWAAMQRRSLDGGVLSFFASQVALVVLLRDAGSVVSGDFVTSVVYLNLLVAICQLVHAVNLDRLAALAEVEARVESRTARLREMTERALDADAAKTRFLATVSHEVRTPLNGVLGMASVVLESPLEPETRRNVEIIRTSGFHLLDVINRILDFSQLDQTRGTEDAEVFDLREVIEEVFAEARYLPYAQGLSFRLLMDRGIPSRRLGHRQALRQVLTNLVGNAAKFTYDGGVIVEVVVTGSETLRLDVRDTGIGVAQADQERIFLPYEQAEGPRGHRTGGTGLGLAIVAEAVRRMGGRVGVESTLGQGSTFWVEVPLPVADGVRGEAIPLRTA